MKKLKTDLLIIGAGPVGLMCAYLARLCSIETLIIDKSSAPLQVGRADALNARTLQLLSTVGLFDELYPLGKPCNTSSVWADGKFISRQSTWWEQLEGCFHKHFLMLSQAYVEQTLDKKLQQWGVPVHRQCSALDIQVSKSGCIIELDNQKVIHADYLIGADGSRSFVRNYFQVPFEITRPQITWAVIDGVINTDFQKVPEIIVFQAETSDVAWIPREANIDRFYVRMDTKVFTMEQAIKKINRAMAPHQLRFTEVVWFSQFSVKESVAENFFLKERIFLAGDACHIHSVNGGQGLNTGLADAFNLIWKLNMVINHEVDNKLLSQYEAERKSVARSVIETSGQLVRATKYSKHNRHALDYVQLVAQHAGNITGMGINYNQGQDELQGMRLFDLYVYHAETSKRLYTLLDYTKFTLLIFSDEKLEAVKLPSFVRVIQIYSQEQATGYYTKNSPYENHILLVRPDAYIGASLTMTAFNTSSIQQLFSMHTNYY